MKAEKIIAMLLKRVYILEKMAADLTVITVTNRDEILADQNSAVLGEPVNKAIMRLTERRIPFNPDCSKCGRSLEAIHEETRYEILYCPECEEWFFPTP